MLDLSPIVLPAPGNHRWTIIWMHGLGADGNDFVPVAQALGLREVKYVFPNAPIAPVTLNHGMSMRSWYDIKTLDVVPDRESLNDVRSSAQANDALVKTESEALGGHDRIILAGFSQGGAMAYHCGLRATTNLAGLICWSTYIVAPEQLESEMTHIGKTIPIFAAHGSFDGVVGFQRGRESFDLVQKLTPDRPMEFQSYPMDHEVCLEEVQALKVWLVAKGVQ